ncbi:MAG: bifunctional diaminohydroxyphosphoribosylaminopyrimidine deaminase/5-amino-6-(5-phosphoribosylamino)uracil reductase RibD [Candidatus Omnitrophica bacterium]|nr:bifunctional diaminohydroxyphosphoribosylaminopyrimidine deaminase/5-amino-6-(5-phosphoribosylamino)uracil reductase RibD [Candidatus Omnitrophota bacterium]
MRLALDLAARARWKTGPNPMVGAVVVRGGRVVGRGFHAKAGAPHAEVIALRQAGPLAKGATLYVSLEPCDHTGRTPPCTEAVLRSGVRRVVAAMVDPNPLTRGKGFRRLRRRGLRIRTGVLEKEARALNRVFVTRMRLKRPFVTVKVAQSLDGKIATAAGESRWISGPEAREWVHRFRDRVDAVLVGVGTVLKDDPLLTVRLKGKKKEPVRVVLDARLRTPPSAELFSSKAPLLIATTLPPSSKAAKRLARAGAEILRLPGSGGRVSLKALLSALTKREVSHLLVEGGGNVIASFFEARAVDELYWIIAPKIIGGRDAPTSVEGRGRGPLSGAVPLRNLTITSLGKDLLLRADVHWDR